MIDRIGEFEKLFDKEWFFFVNCNRNIVVTIYAFMTEI